MVRDGKESQCAGARSRRKGVMREEAEAANKSVVIESWRPR